MAHTVFQLRVRLSADQLAILRVLFGSDGAELQLQPQSPLELCDALRQAPAGSDDRPVVVLNFQPMPAEAMAEGLADFIFFGEPGSVEPLKIESIVVHAKNVTTGNARVMAFSAR